MKVGSDAAMEQTLGRPDAARQWSARTRIGLGVKMFGGVLGILLVSLAVGAISIAGLTQTAAQFESINRDDLAVGGAVQRATVAIGSARSALDAITSGRPDPSGAETRRLRVEVEDAARRLQTIVTDPGAQRSAAQFASEAAAYFDAVSEMEALILAGDVAAARLVVSSRAGPLIGQMYASVQEVAERESHVHEARLVQAAAQAATTRQVLLLVLGAGVLVGIVFGVAMTRSLTSRVREQLALVERVASGDLTTFAPVRGSDEISVLAQSLNDMVASLRNVTMQIRQGVAEMAASSSAIRGAAAQQSAGASQQSAAIAETSATIEQVKASAEQAVAHASVVMESTHQVGHVAQEGLDAVHRATAGMEDIRERVAAVAENILVLSEQSHQIGEIISAVNDLADQSNLPALNAAIEASRAGEHGKGFSVVAAEIRALAEQSKTATAQVRAILSDIQRATNAAVMAMEQGSKGVEAGMQLVDEAGRTIGELAEIVEPAEQAVAQISMSVQQHAVGMEQVAVAMGQIREAAGHNIAAANTTERAVESLDESAGRLSRLVASYRV